MEKEPQKTSPPFPILLKYILKGGVLILIFLLLLTGLFLVIRQNHYETPIQRWKNLNSPNFNLFKFFGFKWISIICLATLICGLLYAFPIWKIIDPFLQRRRLIEFAKEVHMAVVVADVGKGKTLLLSILANSMPQGIKKVGFVSNVPDAQLLSYNDINFHEPISQKDNYRLNKYFFLDETNFWIEGVEHTKNRIYHKGVAFLLQIIRHHKTRLWISATRGNHVWIHVREIVNYFVKLSGLKHILDAVKHDFYTLRVQFYSQSWELVKDFTILVPDWDFNLYDSYWLKGTSVFRPILPEEKVGHFAPKLEEMSEEDKNYELEAERKLKEHKDYQTLIQVAQIYNSSSKEPIKNSELLQIAEYLPKKREKKEKVKKINGKKKIVKQAKKET